MVVEGVLNKELGRLQKEFVANNGREYGVIGKERLHLERIYKLGSPRRIEEEAEESLEGIAIGIVLALFEVGVSDVKVVLHAIEQIHGELLEQVLGSLQFVYHEAHGILVKVAEFGMIEKSLGKR
jgi:hypothetical protein